MKYLRSSDEEWKIFVDEFDKLIQKNNSVICITAMNLSTDWKAHFIMHLYRLRRLEDLQNARKELERKEKES